MFFIKPSKAIVDFFTTEPIVLDVNAPRSAAKDLPKWWSELPKSLMRLNEIHPVGTAKKCPAIIDYFAKSLCIPMWCDFIAEIGPIGTTEYAYRYADLKSHAHAESAALRGSFLPETKYQHMELMTFWSAKTKKNINWVVTHPSWCLEHPSPVILPPAILNFHWQRKLNANIFIPRLPDAVRRLEIGAGQPLYFITPMTECRIETRLHRVSASELDKLDRPTLFFVGDALRARKCPIHK